MSLTTAMTDSKHWPAHGTQSEAESGLTANPVHGHCNGLVGLAGDGTQGHAACAEALHDAGSGLHLIYRDGLSSWQDIDAIPQHSCWAVLKVLLVGIICLLHMHTSLVQPTVMQQQRPRPAARDTHVEQCRLKLFAPGQQRSGLINSPTRFATE